MAYQYHQYFQANQDCYVNINFLEWSEKLILWTLTSMLIQQKTESGQYMDHDNQTKKTREELESGKKENLISKQP